MSLERILSNNISLSWKKPKKCSVCYDIFSFSLYDSPSGNDGKTYRPFILTCYHNACESCVKKSYLYVKCGECGTKTKVDASYEYTQIIEPNFYLNGLLYYVEKDLHKILQQNYKISANNPTQKTVNRMNQKDSRQECYECNYDTNYFCVQCGVPYCQRCYTNIHNKAKALRKHTFTFIARNNLNLTFGANKNHSEHKIYKCKTHPRKYSDHYCNDCYETCCDECVTTDHATHDVKTIEEKNNDYIPIVKTLVGNVKSARDKTRTSIKMPLFRNTPTTSVQNETKNPHQPQSNQHKPIQHQQTQHQQTQHQSTHHQPIQQPNNSGTTNRVSSSNPKDLNPNLNAKMSEVNALAERGYTIGKKLGKGTYATVITAQFHEETGRNLNLACKIIDKAKAPQDFLEKFFPRELDILTKIEHPYIIQIHSILQRGQKIFIFMRCAENGDLLEYIKTNGPIKEVQAKIWFSQMCRAIKYLHSLDISHRDLKCENLLLSKRMNVKIADFGFARYCTDKIGNNCKSETYCGSAAYASPEVVNGTPYDAKKADAWSLGVILFIMLNAKMPFDDSNLQKLLNNQRNRQYQFRNRIAERTSNQAKSMVNVLLDPNPITRWDLNLVLNSTWLKQIESEHMG